MEGSVAAIIGVGEVGATGEDGVQTGPRVALLRLVPQKLVHRLLVEGVVEGGGGVGGEGGEEADGEGLVRQRLQLPLHLPQLLLHLRLEFKQAAILVHIPLAHENGIEDFVRAMLHLEHPAVLHPDHRLPRLPESNLLVLGQPLPHRRCARRTAVMAPPKAIPHVLPDLGSKHHPLQPEEEADAWRERQVAINDVHLIFLARPPTRLDQARDGLIKHRTRCRQKLTKILHGRGGSERRLRERFACPR
mmetsp:Transcript_41611/g.85077  ORF Transcript_41611/g.85077 Transcript_41611/m.85077 type:complete len:247 (+) Transcript_41611:171-911(+)